MAKTVLPDSVSKALHVRILDEMAADRLSGIDIGVVMVYLIDTAPAAALPYLGEQFNLSGYKGWKFADTEEKQRDLIKRAIELHRYKGTVYGIKEALKLAGVVGDIEIRENLTLTYNGDWTYGGIVFYGHHWAYFRVLIDIANLDLLPLADIKAVINEYKNARSWLLDVTYYQAHTDSVGASDDLVQGLGNVDTDVVGSHDTLTNTVI